MVVCHSPGEIAGTSTTIAEEDCSFWKRRICHNCHIDGHFPVMNNVFNEKPQSIEKMNFVYCISNPKTIDYGILWR